MPEYKTLYQWLVSAPRESWHKNQYDFVIFKDEESDADYYNVNYLKDKKTYGFFRSCDD